LLAVEVPDDELNFLVGQTADNKKRAEFEEALKNCPVFRCNTAHITPL